MNRHECLPYHSFVYLEEDECETCLTIVEYVDKCFRFGIVKETRLKLIWCYLFYNKERDIHYFIYDKKMVVPP